MVDWVWVTMSPGAYQKFAIFVVEILDGNTAEYKPCAQFEGRFHEQQVKFSCNNGTGQLGQFVYIRDDRVDNEYFGLCEVQAFQRREVPDCGQPESPVYSKVTSLGPGSVLYTCSQGYTIIGERLRNCTHQGWQGAAPECRGQNDTNIHSQGEGGREIAVFNWVNRTEHIRPKLAGGEGRW